jgi:hypothetical protein
MWANCGPARHFADHPPAAAGPLDTCATVDLQACRCVRDGVLPAAATAGGAAGPATRRCWLDVELVAVCVVAVELRSRLGSSRCEVELAAVVRAAPLVVTVAASVVADVSLCRSSLPVSRFLTHRPRRLPSLAPASTDTQSNRRSSVATGLLRATGSRRRRVTTMRSARTGWMDWRSPRGDAAAVSVSSSIAASSAVCAPAPIATRSAGGGSRNLPRGTTGRFAAMVMSCVRARTFSAGSRTSPAGASCRQRGVGKRTKRKTIRFVRCANGNAWKASPHVAGGCPAPSAREVPSVSVWRSFFATTLRSLTSIS